MPVLPWQQLKAVQILRLEGNQIDVLDDSLSELVAVNKEEWEAAGSSGL
jgi:hypothetical protein